MGSSRSARTIVRCALAVLLCSSAFGVRAEPTTQFLESTVSNDSRGENGWTTADIVEVPEFMGLALDSSARHAMYIVRVNSIAAGKRVYELGIVDLDTGRAQTLLTSPWMEQLSSIPKSLEWSLLADIGRGVQLYRVDKTGTMTPMVESSAPVIIGEAPGLVPGIDEAPQQFGVVGFGWSADASAFWYCLVRAAEDSSGRREPFAWDGKEWWVNLVYRRIGEMELRIRHLDGTDLSVTTVLTEDDPVRVFPASVAWDSDALGLTYRRSKVAEGGVRTVETYRASAKTGASQRLEAAPAEHPAESMQVIGPNGGELLLEEGKLAEKVPGGHLVSYGLPGISPYSIREVGRDRKHKQVLVQVQRQGRNVRNGLMLLNGHGSVSFIGGDEDIDQCVANDGFRVAVCVRQSVSRAPELVVVDVQRDTIRTLVRPSERHSVLDPLLVKSFEQVNADGTVTTGFIYYPRFYRETQSYPAIFVTHGWDVANRFVDQDLQWDFPVQVWAERGYVVVCVNEPSMSKSERDQAMLQWSLKEGDSASVESVQRWVYDSVVQSFEQVAERLIARGLIQRDRIGIVGYSRGSQIVNIAMTRSKLFRAASSGEGGYAEPAGYFANNNYARGYRVLYGGSPYEEAATYNYRRWSPTFRAAHAAGPILQQVGMLWEPQVEFFMSLRDAGVPTELFIFPGETHQFHDPRNRLRAMEQNLDWFDFWLLGKESDDPRKSEQYQRWRKLRSRE